jgi:DNA-binding HxlR family transcriptional regulator
MRAMRMTSESENVLKALSSSTRRTIMRQISEKGSATYTEIMRVLNLDPSLMSGTFNYHLKELNEARLIERTDGEYTITDLGKRALILVDQVAKDVKIDQYGVLSAVMSMSPRKELELFMSQMGMMIGLVMSVLSIIPFGIGYATDALTFWLLSTPLLFFLVLGVVSVIKMIKIVRKFRVGLSVIVFLSSYWFFIRSPNRNRFFAIILLTVLAVMLGALAFLLPCTGDLALLIPEWYGLIVGATSSAILSIVLSVQAKRRADRLEAMNSE